MFMNLQMTSSLQSLYSFWQYDVCDVFIELVKPVVQQKDSSPAAEAEKTAYRETLWLCLDAGLRQDTSYCTQRHNLKPILYADIQSGHLGGKYAK